MKKTTIIIAFAVTVSVAVFQSCAGNSNANTMMPKPEMEASELDSQNEESVQLTNAADAPAADAAELNYQNMQAAFKGETTASAKYAAYSKKAEEEGLHQIAMLFKAASLSEKIHAGNHKAVLEDAGQKIPVIVPEFTVNSTKDNLKDAITGEGYEVSTMYPEFMTNANTAGNQLSLMSLNYAYKTEKKHKVFYEKALAALESNTVETLPSEYYICPTCGNTYDSAAPKRCGISMTSSEKFIKIDNLNS